MTKEGLGQCLFGSDPDNYCHRFEARYDEEMPADMADVMKEIIKNNEWLPELIKNFKKRIYVHDICTKCGAVVKREE